MPNTESPRYSVLCIDDEQNILRSIKRALFSLKIDLTLAESGEQALAIMEQKTVHVVISDMKMPKGGPKLSPEVIADFEKWVAAGVPDPRKNKPSKE